MIICDLCNQSENKPIIPRDINMTSPGMRGDFMNATLDLCNKCSINLKNTGFKQIFKAVLGLDNGKNAV